MAEVLGILKHPHATVEVIRTLKDAGFRDMEVYSPVPSHERPRTSPVQPKSAIPA